MIGTIVDAYRQTHERLLALAEPLSDEQLNWRAATTAPSIAFCLWHLGRWADHLHAAIPTMTPELGQLLGQRQQLWEREGLVAKWGFDPTTLGQDETGMLMDDEAAAQLPLPRKEVLLDYVRRAFAAAEETVEVIDERQLYSPHQQHASDEATRAVQSSSSTVVGAVLVHLTHENRHLGMIECLLGLQGQSGTATK